MYSMSKKNRQFEAKTHFFILFIYQSNHVSNDIDIYLSRSRKKGKISSLNVDSKMSTKTGRSKLNVSIYPSNYLSNNIYLSI